MISLILVAALLTPQETTYAELSRKHGLGGADQLLKDGKFLEASVAYRNVLMTSGDREAVRIPLALALLAKGDAAYAGIELRRAHMLCPDFSRIVVDPAALFGSKGALVKAADAALGKETNGDGGAEVNAVAAYAYLLEGEGERAKAALAKYEQSRGSDAFVRDLKAALAKDVTAKPPAAAPAAPEPALRGGAPVRAGVRSVETEARPRGEILFR
jgi:thioredoxin-like negative regulator of GroEL